MSGVRARPVCGFSLIELLVVLAIIVILASVLTPIVTIARDGARRSTTQSLLSKVDAGLEMFKQDIGVYPYQEIDAAIEAFPPVDNLLAYHLTRDLTDAEQLGLQGDADAAAGEYDVAPHRFTATTPLIIANQADSSVRGANAAVVNRMGRERARLMTYAGHTKLKGLANNPTLPLNPGATSKGWGAGYLAGDIPSRNVLGDAIVDGEGVPLLYICPVVCGIKGIWAASAINDGNSRSFFVDPDKFGFRTIGRTVTVALASDLRTSAPAAYANTFELWSLGPDRIGDKTRSARQNRDNMPAKPYLRGLEP
jgi:prepilin-type N-terminal cleavage/methylation domain-containing protein